MTNKDDNSNVASGVKSNTAEYKSSPVNRKSVPERTLQFESLISGFSAALISTPEDDLENVLNSWLKKFVEFLKVDRCIVNEFMEDGKTVHRLLNYTVPDIDITPVLDNYRPPEGAIRELGKGILVRAEKVPEDLPPIFRGGIIEKTNTKSIVIAPLTADNRMIGSLLFASFRKRRKWSDDTIRRIKLIGEIIANAIVRIHSHKSLHQEIQRRKVLEDRYSAILKHANVGFILSDLNHNILEVNDEYCRMSGYSRGELLAKKVWEIDASTNPDKVGKEARELEKDRVMRFITSHRRKDGSLFDVEVNGNFFEEEEGIICTFLRDITDLNKAREQLEERLEFEELVSEFSNTLINLNPADISEELNLLIKKLVEFFKVDRGVIGEYIKDPSSVKILMSHSVSDILINPLKESYSVSESLMKEYEKGIIIRAERINEELPAEIREWALDENIKSLAIIPLTSENKVIGNITLASHRKEQNWPDDLIMRIKLVGEIIANAILRMRSHEILLQEVERREMLEQRYSSILKNASVGFMIINFSDLSIIDVNDEYCRMSGFSREEITSKKVWELDAAGNPEKVEQERASMMDQKGIIHLQTRHVKKDRGLIDVLISANFFAEEGIVCNFIRDVTELKTTQKELEERLEFEELISDFSAALINISPEDIYGVVNNWLREFVEFLKVGRGAVVEYHEDQDTVDILMHYTVPGIDAVSLERSNIIKKEVMDELKKGLIIRAEKIPEDLPPVFHKVFTAKSIVIVPLLSGDKAFGNLSFACYTEERKWSDEFVRRIKLIGEIISSAILRLRSYEALITEMERRQMLENKYSLILENASVGFMITDYSDFSILDVNDEYCRMSGYSRDELLSKKIWEIDVSRDPEKVTQDRKNIMEQKGINHFETSHIRKDNSMIEVSVSANIFVKEGTVCCFIRDVTDLKKAQKELEERLEFEELVSEFSAALINIKLDNVNEELSQWLIRFSKFLEVERGVISEFLPGNKKSRLLMAYTSPEVLLPALNDSFIIPEEIMEEFQKGATIRSETVPDGLPPILHESVKIDNTKSVLIVPLITGEQIIGNLAFATYTKERRWSDELVRRIKLIGEIVANAILRKRSHEALVEEMNRRQQLEERYTSIIKTANVGFWISDLNARILEANDAYCKMSGYSHDELLCMTIDQIDAFLKPDEIIGIGNSIIEKGEGHIETSHIRKDGTNIEVAVNSRFLEKEGVIFSFARDITELNKARKELEERLKFEELISEFSADLINVKIEDIKSELNTWLERFAEFLNIDRWGVGEYSDNYKYLTFICTYSNPNLDPAPPPFVLTPIPSIYGLEKYLQKGEYIKLDSPDDIFPDDIRFWRQLVIDDGAKSVIVLPLMAGDVLLGNMVIACMANERKWTQDLIRRLNLVAEIFSNAFMREKTDSELDNYRKHLEKMVDERTAELEEAQIELVISEKMATLGRLTATVSHELRNPLGTVRSSVFSVQRRLKGGDEKVMKALDRAERNIRRCDLIIDELLNYSRVRDLKLEPIPVDTWIEEVLEETGPPKGISVNKELNSTVITNMDQERFRRCMVNILTNAYQAIQEKDGDEPGYVHVKTYNDINNLIIEISDNGVGFDMGNKNKIFEPLFSTKTFGVGLGVPITRQIIEQHGWTMDMMGEPQKGASVRISIPLEEKK